MTGPFEIPATWAWATLGEIADVVGGVTKDSKRQSDPSFVEVPYLRVANVQRGYLDLSRVATIRVPEQKVNDLQLQRGDVLLNEGGDRDKLGRGWIWENQLPVCIHQNHVFRARVYKGILHPKILAWHANGFGQQWFQSNGLQSVNLASISLSKMREFPVPIPPLAEQGHIVAALESHLSRLQTGLTSVATSRRRLVSWESALVAAITEGFSKPGRSSSSLPSGWTVRSIGELAQVGTGATPLRSREDFYVDGTVPWVTSSQMNRPFIDVAAKYITEKALAETSVKLWPKGTILMAMYGEGKTRGRCSELRISATTNQACAAIVLKSEWENRRPWVKLVLTASYEQNRRLASGGVQPNLNLSLIRAIQIPIPSLGEQDRLIQEFERQQTLGVKMANSLVLTERRGRSLHRALLSKALSGKLIPQDPSDEPASELLARIRAERAAVPPRQRAARARRTPKDKPAPPTRVIGRDYQQGELPL